MKKLIFSIFFIFLFNQILMANDGPNTWTLSYNNGGRIYAMVVNPVNQNIIYAAGLDSGVYRSTNSGLNWTQVNNGLTYFKVQSLAISKSNPSILFAGTDQLGGANSGIYKTTDGGNNWTYASNGITDSKGIQWIEINPVNPLIAYAAVFDGIVNSTVGLWKTTDGGATWFASNTGIGTIKNMLSLAINPKNPNVVYAGTSFNQNPTVAPTKIYRSNNAGATWNEMSNGLPTGTTTGDPVRWLSISDLDTAVVMAGLFLNDIDGGIYITTNGGQLWQKRHTGLPSATGFLPRSGVIRPNSTSELYVGFDGGTPATSRSVWRSTDQGLSWTQFSNGALPPTTTIRALVFETVGDTTLYAGAADAATPFTRGIYDYTFPNTVGIGNLNEPLTFALAQNYPNPFNPVTTIRFEIAAASDVTVDIYDITGRLVRTLVNEYKQAGRYDLLMDASDLSSGLYIYKLRAGTFTDSKKMMLIK
jgi:photosystem II stability/assembly factor-like uncharacterized protein